MKIWIPIRPYPAPRPRVVKGHAYNDKKYTEVKKIIGMVSKRKIDKKYLAGEALGLKIDFFFEIPKSWSKSKKENAKWHTSRPDADNLAKTIKDSLNGILYDDDSQVSWLHIRKQYAQENGILIEVIEL